MTIPSDFIAEVQRKNDIYQVVSKYVELKQVGKNWKGLCPFHKEKTPSFTLDSVKQVFKCFGCGKGGNVIHFVKEKERKTFPEAIYTLALNAGLLNSETAKYFNIEDKKITGEIVGDVYILGLENDKYYIGFTNNIDHRLEQHAKGEGAVWTKKHKVKTVIEIIKNVPIEMEDEKTEEYMRKYGWKNVRGGCFVFSEMNYKDTPNNISQIKKDGAYLLLLENNKYYIGYSTNVYDDIQRQFRSQGCEWTKIYKPIKILKIVKSLNPETQKNMTLIAMKDLGWQNVRGYRWLALDLKMPPELNED